MASATTHRKATAALQRVRILNRYLAYQGCIGQGDLTLPITERVIVCHCTEFLRYLGGAPSDQLSPADNLRNTTCQSSWLMRWLAVANLAEEVGLTHGKAGGYPNVPSTVVGANQTLPPGRDIRILGRHYQTHWQFLQH